jgi:uncharacterized glyoxalase superfamily protein PhnB
MSTTAAFYPEVLFRDADAGMGWLEETLGFERREDYRDDDGHVVHAELGFGGGIVMVASAEVGREPFRSVPPGNALVYCAIEEIEALYDRAREAGAKIELELTESEQGKDFTARDPEGNLWAFGTYRPGAPGA